MAKTKSKGRDVLQESTCMYVKIFKFRPKNVLNLAICAALVCFVFVFIVFGRHKPSAALFYLRKGKYLHSWFFFPPFFTKSEIRTCYSRLFFFSFFYATAFVCPFHFQISWHVIRQGDEWDMLSAPAVTTSEKPLSELLNLGQSQRSSSGSALVLSGCTRQLPGVESSSAAVAGGKKYGNLW